MWKVPAISGIISVVLLFVVKVMMDNMDLSEKFSATIDNRYPKRVTVMSSLWLISVIVAIISLIVCIVKA